MAMKLVAKLIATSTAKDLLRLSPLAARTDPFLPPEARLVIESVRVTCDSDTEQLLVSVYRASDTGTGTACTADVVDLSGGAAVFAGTAAKNLTVAASKTELVDSQENNSAWGYEWDEAEFTLMPGQHLVVRLEDTPGAPPVNMTVEVTFCQY